MSRKRVIIVTGIVAAFGAGFLYEGSKDTEATAGAALGRPVKNEAAFKAPGLSPTNEVKTETLLLSKSNVITLRSAVGALSVSKAQTELLDKNGKLPKGQPIYLVLDTPGGSIDAGNQLVDTAKSLGRPVHTVTLFAASMGFSFVQRLDKRYIVPSGTLMAHRATVNGVGGQVPGEFLTAAANILTLVTKMEKANAQRLGISFEEYTDLVLNEYWVDGEDAVKQNAADALASIQCDDSLSGTTKETVMSFFGPVDIEWANCPAITMPVSIGFSGTEEQRQVVDQVFSTRRSFRKQGGATLGLEAP